MPDHPEWPEIVTAVRVEGQPIGPFFYKHDRLIPDVPRLESRRYARCDALTVDAIRKQRDEELRERLEKALRETWCDNEDCACCRERAVAARSIFEEADGA